MDKHGIVKAIEAFAEDTTRSPEQTRDDLLDLMTLAAQRRGAILVPSANRPLPLAPSEELSWASALDGLTAMAGIIFMASMVGLWLDFRPRPLGCFGKPDFMETYWMPYLAEYAVGSALVLLAYFIWQWARSRL
jgi:hypothetical protein